MQMMGLRNEARSGYTARDYNLPLITHMYDAVENLGFGSTDHSVGRWVDCVTEDEKTFTIGENSYWDGDSFKRTVALGDFILNIPAVEAGTTTMIVFSNDTPVGTTNPRIVGTSTTARRLEIDVYDSGPQNAPRVYWRSGGSYRSIVSRLGIDFSSVLSFAYLMDADGKFFISVNGGTPQQVGSSYPIDYDFYSGGQTLLNVGAISGASSAMDMTLKNVRRYSSFLTASDLLREYAVDKARFNLPERVGS